MGKRHDALPADSPLKHPVAGGSVGPPWAPAGVCTCRYMRTVKKSPYGHGLSETLYDPVTDQLDV